MKTCFLLLVLFAVPCYGQTTRTIQPTNWGVAVDDKATGPGYIMYSMDNVKSRFGDTYKNNADHLIAVRANDGGWEYNTNSAWKVFEPVDTDVLIAAVDFTNDAVVSLKGISDNYNGIDRGYAIGNLAFEVNRWGGKPNAGEFEVLGTEFTLDDELPPPSPIEVLIERVAALERLLAEHIAVEANDDAFETDEDTPLKITREQLLGNDRYHGTPKITITRQPEHGTVTVAEDGSFVYTPHSTEPQ